MWVKYKIAYKNEFTGYFWLPEKFPEISDYTANMQQRGTLNNCAFASGREIANV